MPTLVTNTTGWVDDLCRRFSHATGWPMEFTPVEVHEATAVEAGLRENAGCSWFSRITDSDQAVGYLHVGLPRGSEGDLAFPAVTELAEIFSQLLGRLYAAERKSTSRAEHVSTLLDIGLSIPNEADLVEALNRLLAAAVQLTGFQSAAFFLLDPSTQRLNLRASHGLRSAEIPSPCRDLAENPPDLEALTKRRILPNPHDSPERSRWLPNSARDAVCVAVELETDAIGTLWAFDSRRTSPATTPRAVSGRFGLNLTEVSDDDESASAVQNIPPFRWPDEGACRVLESVAAQIAAVLERLVLRKENESGERLWRDLQIASESQPADILKDIRGNARVDAAAVCTSRCEVGGDLCELIPVDEARIVVAVGDASGDSIPAALIMSAVRGALRSIPPEVSDTGVGTAAVLERINRVLYDITPPHQFMSLLFGVLDTRARRFHYTNAGHPAPLVIGSGRAVPLDSHGMLLGVVPDATYNQATIELNVEDLLVVFSDGVSEALDRHKQLFGVDGIISVLGGRPWGSAERALQEIWRALEMHTAGGREPDDRTLLVMRMKE